MLECERSEHFRHGALHHRARQSDDLQIRELRAQLRRLMSADLDAYPGTYLDAACMRCAEMPPPICEPSTISRVIAVDEYICVHAPRA